MMEDVATTKSPTILAPAGEPLSRRAPPGLNSEYSLGDIGPPGENMAMLSHFLEE